jgi:hypothetical protein
MSHRLGIRAPLPFLAVGHEIDGPPMFLEAAFYVTANRRIIFDDENAHDNKLLSSRAEGGALIEA